MLVRPGWIREEDILSLSEFLSQKHSRVVYCSQALIEFTCFKDFIDWQQSKKADFSDSLKSIV